MAEYALITGASSGIGLELARIAASNNINLILLARNADKLMQLRTELEERHPIKVLAVGCDLTEPDTVEKVAALLHGRGIVPDILINNAGFGMYGSFDRIGAETEENMIRLNVASLTELTKIIYRQMRSRGKGKILNVSSIAGFMPGPWMAVYHATKAYVLSFSEALAAEARGSGVTVTVLCPGPTETNFENRASAGTGIKVFEKFGKLPAARQVAKYGWQSMMKGKTVAIHGGKNRWLVFLIRFLPRKTTANVAGKIQAPN
ncbi:MAG: SDR family oxidoreductase [Bacteroidales bacterium]|jgi:short-subunit dehydrogenase|nr:SDR family oxidoreductase [Bacteroidales bacterium]